MKSRIIVLIVGVLISGTAQAKGKKYNPPPQTYSKSRLINRSCQAVWAAAMPLMTEAGFTPQTSDRDGGIASFTYGRGSSTNANASNDAKRYTTAPSGFWIGYSVFMIQSATITVIPAPGACTCQMSFNYQGLQHSMAGQRWYMLESNGFMENNVLAEIEKRALASEAALATVKQAGPPKETKPTPSQVEVPKAVEAEKAAQPAKPSVIHIVCPENVLEVPFSSSRPDRRKLNCDEAVTIISEDQKWTRIKTSDGVEGYVAPKFVGK